MGNVVKFEHQSLGVQVTHQDMERVRVRLGLSVEGLCGYLKVSRVTYARWDKRGVPGTVQQFMRIMDEFPKVVMGTLAPEKDEG